MDPSPESIISIERVLPCTAPTDTTPPRCFVQNDNDRRWRLPVNDQPSPACPTLADLLEDASRSPAWLDMSAPDIIALGRRLRESQWQTILALMDKADYRQALPLLEELTDLTPRDGRFPRRLLDCQARLGLTDETRQTLAQLKPQDRPAAGALPPAFAIAEESVRRGVEERRQRRCARRLYPSTLGRGDPAAFDPRCLSGETLTIVTGLPRSGTSLMMQMLRRGGMDICSDLNHGDEDNPGGYVECRRLQRYWLEPVLLEGVGSAAVKLLNPVLDYLPVSHRYDIVFMLRPLEQVLASQRTFVGRHPEQQVRFAAANMSAQAQRDMRERILSRLRRWPQVNLLIVQYTELVADPQRHARRLAEFLGTQRLPDAQGMASLVDARLFRNRSDERLPAASND